MIRLKTGLSLVLQDLRLGVSLAHSFDKGIRNSAGLASVQDIVCCVISQHGAAGERLLLIEGSNEANGRIHWVFPAGKLHVPSFDGRSRADAMYGGGPLDVTAGSDDWLALAAALVRGQDNPGGQEVIRKGLKQLRVGNKIWACQYGVKACNQVVVVQQGHCNKPVEYLMPVCGVVAIEFCKNGLMFIPDTAQDGLPELKEAPLAKNLRSELCLECIALRRLKVQHNSKFLIVSSRVLWDRHIYTRAPTRGGSNWGIGDWKEVKLSTDHTQGEEVILLGTELYEEELQGQLLNTNVVTLS